MPRTNTSKHQTFALHLKKIKLLIVSSVSHAGVLYDYATETEYILSGCIFN